MRLIISYNPLKHGDLEEVKRHTEFVLMKVLEFCHEQHKRRELELQQQRQQKQECETVRRTRSETVFRHRHKSSNTTIMHRRRALQKVKEWLRHQKN